MPTYLFTIFPAEFTLRLLTRIRRAATHKNGSSRAIARRRALISDESVRVKETFDVDALLMLTPTILGKSMSAVNL